MGLISFDPAENPKAISIVQEEDGNWRGYMRKFGKVITVRQGDPQIVLQMLLTHDGK